MGLGQYNSLGEYCGLSTASSVFLILLPPEVARGAYFHGRPIFFIIFTSGFRGKQEVVYDSLCFMVVNQLRNTC